MNLDAVDVTAAILEKDGRYLIARRPEGVHLATLWEFPGGKREPDETLERCLAREIAEELGVLAEIGPLWKRVVYVYPEKTVALHFFVCRILEGEPRAIHATEIAWASPAEFGLYRFPAADESVLEAIAIEKPAWPNL